LVFDVQLDLLTSNFSSLLDVFNDKLAHSESFYNSRISGVPRYSSRPQQNSAKLSLKLQQQVWQCSDQPSHFSHESRPLRY